MDPNFEKALVARFVLQIVHFDRLVVCMARPELVVVRMTQVVFVVVRRARAVFVVVCTARVVFVAVAAVYIGRELFVPVDWEAREDKSDPLCRP